MAPGTGQRSTHAAQNEVSAMQKRPWMMAVRGVALSATAVGSTGGAGAAFFWKVLAKAEKNPRLETASLIWVEEQQRVRGEQPQARAQRRALALVDALHPVAAR
jgi:hypothetical protein